MNPAISTIPSLTAGLITWDKRYSWKIRQIIKNVLCMPSCSCFHASSQMWNAFSEVAYNPCSFFLWTSSHSCFNWYYLNYRWVLIKRWFKSQRNYMPNTSLTEDVSLLGGHITTRSCFTCALKNIAWLTDRWGKKRMTNWSFGKYVQGNVFLEKGLGKKAKMIPAMIQII